MGLSWCLSEALSVVPTWCCLAGDSKSKVVIRRDPNPSLDGPILHSACRQPAVGPTCQVDSQSLSPKGPATLDPPSGSWLGSFIPILLINSRGVRGATGKIAPRPHGGLYCWDSGPPWGSESMFSS